MLRHATCLVHRHATCLVLLTLLLRARCGDDVDYRHLSLDFDQPLSATKRPRASYASTILVTGGAGYIGSTMVLLLLENSIYTVVVVDNLSRGSPANVAALRSSAHRYQSVG